MAHTSVGSGDGGGAGAGTRAVRDGGGAGGSHAGKSDGAIPFGFGQFGVDAATPTAATADAGRTIPLPDGWRCRPELGRDQVCDCGCGAPDAACVTLGCVTPSCSLPVCQACFDADGEVHDCGAPGAWVCERALRADGVCDCGCGALDPDCPNALGCYQPGCNVEGCQQCHGADGAAACATPAPFRCAKSVKGDGLCDCGCGNYDPDCKHRSCVEAGCAASGCDVCHDRTGKPIACTVPTPGWACEPARRGDGVCDCGCGDADPDCGDAGCAEAGCSADACTVCHDAFGREQPCPGLFTCGAARFGDGRVCDCGCGRADPDCGGAGCTAAACVATACDQRHDESGRPIRPDAFTCAASAYGRGDGCDCGCGAPDPDCNGGGCSAPGCRASACDHCRGADGASFECRWTCDLARFGDGQHCDCGCGAFDPDCSGLGCYAPGCYADVCARCVDSSGHDYACQRGACRAGYEQDGICDCGCRQDDAIDCAAADACVEPGCSADGCGRCHDANGAVTSCKDWSCGLEQQGGGDGCNCGCGAPDPDCAPGQGCSAAGCLTAGCITCRAPDGAPMSCSL